MDQRDLGMRNSYDPKKQHLCTVSKHALDGSSRFRPQQLFLPLLPESLKLHSGVTLLRTFHTAQTLTLLHGVGLQIGPLLVQQACYLLRHILSHKRPTVPHCRAKLTVTMADSSVIFGFSCGKNSAFGCFVQCSSLQFHQQTG